MLPQVFSTNEVKINLVHYNVILIHNNLNSTDKSTADTL